MEIYQFHNAIKETQPELYHNISHAIDILKKSLHVYTAAELCFSFNGGKDSTVILHLLRYLTYLQETKDISGHSSSQNEPVTHSSTTAAIPTIPPSSSPSPSSSSSFLGIKFIYFEAPDNFPAVLEFMQTMEKQYNFKLHHVNGFHTGLQKLGQEGIKGVLMGTRKHDPDGIHLDYFTPTSLNWPPCMRICPILYWPYHHIWLFLRGCNVPYCYLYNEGYTSLGSLGDSLPNPCLRRYRKVPKDSPNPIDLKVKTVLEDEPYYLPAWELENGEMERLGRTSKRKTTNNGNTNNNHSSTVVVPYPSLPVVPTFRLTDALVSSTASSSSPTAAIVAIGNELLNGKIMDTNIKYLANELRKQGINVLITLTIPDTVATIGPILNALSSSYTYVFTTGGLGVTHDDNTMQGISLGFNLPLIKNKELEILQYAMAVSRWRKYHNTLPTTTNNSNKNNNNDTNTTTLSTEYMEEAIRSCLRMAYVPTGEETFLLWSSTPNGTNNTTTTITKTSSLSSSSSASSHDSSVDNSITMETLLHEYPPEKVTEILQKGYPLVQIHNVYIFPGVPAILQRKWESYKSLFQGPQIVTKEFCIKGILLVYYGGEALIASLLESFTKEYPQYSIGSYPVPHYDSYEPYRTNHHHSPPITSSSSSPAVNDHDICITVSCTGDDADKECTKGITLLQERLLQKYPSLSIL